MLVYQRVRYLRSRKIQMEKIVALYVALMTEKPKSHPDGPPCWLPTCEVAQDSSPWIYTVSSNSSRMFKVKLKFSWWIPFAYCLSSQFSLVIPGFTGVFSMVSVYVETPNCRCTMSWPQVYTKINEPIAIFNTVTTYQNGKKYMLKPPNRQS